MKKRREEQFHLIRILISILLGFVPSFVFVILLVQYGNPFVNYINFLSNLKSSYGAWASAVLLSFFAYFLISILTPKDSLKKILKNKVLFAILIFCFVVAFLLMAVQLFLYANFILRNDILVEISATNEDIFFTNNPEEHVTFNINLIMNPFCSAYCEYQFSDLGLGDFIERGSFSTTILSKKRDYILTNNNLVEGSQELRQFEINCRSRKTLFCYTSERESRRKILLTINYKLNEEEKEFKKDSKTDLEEVNNFLFSSGKNLMESFDNVNLINGLFEKQSFYYEAESLKKSYNLLNSSFENSAGLWKRQNFDSLKSSLLELKNQSLDLINATEKLKNNIFSNISLYNNLTEEMMSSRNTLNKISILPLENSTCVLFNKLISDYNSAVINFKDAVSLGNKKIISNEIHNNVSEFDSEYQNLGGELCPLDEEINNENLTSLEIVYSNISIENFSLSDPEPVCCFRGNCEKCFGDESSDNNYPILFLHGQSINKAISIGYSFDDFSEVKEKLVTKNYIDAGSVILDSVPEGGLWGKVNSTLIMTGSYFFDTYKTERGEVSIASNNETIDTYAVRLNKLIKFVKFRTNKNKVVIAAHSMGGIVTRRYLQIFGDDDVDKVILVTVPNHGVDDKVREYCSVIGPEASCNDLDSDGVFMKNLNENSEENISIYNIIGIGCNMGNEFGDGVIKNSSQYLESAENYYFKGTCDEINFRFLHEYIIFPEFHPEVYEKIYSIFNND